MRWRGLLLGLALLCASGCVRLATAPLRQEQVQKAQAAFARLASFTPQQIAQFFDDRMSVGLGLSATQLPKVAAINLKYAARLHDVAASSDSVRGKIARARDLDDSKDGDLKPVLTPDQFTRYESLKEQFRAALRAWATGERP